MNKTGCVLQPFSFLVCDPCTAADYIVSEVLGHLRFLSHFRLKHQIVSTSENQIEVHEQDSNHDVADTSLLASV